MKVPLRFQVTEYDCGTISLLNAFGYLFEREELPAELIRAIHIYTLDCIDEMGNIGACGTSIEAINKLIHWITIYANKNSFNVKCQSLEKDKVSLENIKKCLSNHGCVFIKCWQTCEHYVIITKIDSKYAYIFDSYYLIKKDCKKDKNIKIIINKPFTYNRKVTIKRLFSETNNDFSLGRVNERQCVLINKIL